MRWKSIVLRYTPVVGVALGILLYPLVWQYAQEGRARQITMPETTTFRVLLGVGDTEPTTWDGTVKLTGGKITSIQGWRFADGDSSDYQSSWKASTRRAGPQNAAQRNAGQGGPILENGVLIAAVLSSPHARFEIRTPRGSFSFAVQEIPMGESKVYLDAKV